MNEGEKNVIEVVAALIRDDQDRYLIGQRPLGKAQGGLWEFVGGKIEPGETPKEAIARECREELGCRVIPQFVLQSLVHEYEEKTIRLTFVACTLAKGETPRPIEHMALKWLRVKTIRNIVQFKFCPADFKMCKFFFLGIREDGIEPASMAHCDRKLFWLGVFTNFPELIPCCDDFNNIEGWMWQSIIDTIKEN